MPKEYVKPEPVDVADILSEVVPATLDWSALDVSVSPKEQKDVFAVKKHASWDKSTEARCDFTPHLRLTRRAGVCFVSLWEKSLYGRTLTEIKGDDAMIGYFAENLSPIIKDVLGCDLPKGHWAVCTTPKRRHLTRNFATLIAADIARRLAIPFYEDVAHCHSKHRIGAIFTLGVLPEEPNLIVFDDFVTTGSTLQSMFNLLRSHGKNTVFFAGINNKL